MEICDTALTVLRNEVVEKKTDCNINLGLGFFRMVIGNFAVKETENERNRKE